MAYPSLPAQVPVGDIERDLIDNEPPGLFPDGQDSLWGQIRKVFADYLQVNIADKLSLWYDNLDPRTTDISDMPEWEYLTNVPYAPGTLTLEQRRQFVVNRLYTGLFTRTIRRAIVESFVIPTLGGTPTDLTPAGIPLDAGGITLFSGATGDPRQYYRIYENVRSFEYEVRVLNTLGIDTPGLARELRRITPAGINPADMSTKIVGVAQILDYFKATIDGEPNAFWQLGSNADSTTYAANLTANGGLTFGGIASPGLLNASVLGVSAATDFDGTDDYASVAHQPQFNLGNVFSIEFWMQADSFTGNPRIVSKGGLAWEVYVNSAGELRLQQDSTANFLARATPLLTTGTTYHVLITKDGTVNKVYLNGVDVTQAGSAPNTLFTDNTNAITIGRSNGAATSFYNGRLQGLALYNRTLTAAEALAKYKTGINQTI